MFTKEVLVGYCLLERPICFTDLTLNSQTANDANDLYLLANLAIFSAMRLFLPFLFPR